MSTPPTTMSELLATRKGEEMLAKLEEMNALLRSPVEQPTTSSAPLTSIFTADTEEREASASTIPTKPATTSSASFITSPSTKPATTSSTSLTPSPTSAPPQDADPGFQSGVTELSYTRDPPISTDGDLCIRFDADDGDVDRLSRLPDSLLRDIVARLPIKDAGRTAVLSSRWSPIWCAAPLLIGHADLAVLHLNSDRFYDLVPRSPDRLLEQIRLQLQGRARPLLANNDPGSCPPASDASWPPTSAGTRSWPRRPRCWTTRQYPPSPASATITACVHTDVRHLPDTFIQLTELQDVTRATPIGSLVFLSAMHTKCSIQGHGSHEVTTLSLCAFSMTAIAIKGTLGVLKDWQEQPWPPPMLVEILGRQVEEGIIKLRPNPWPSFEHSVYLIHRVNYMLLSCGTSLQQLENLTGFSIIWDVSILNLFADPSKCRAQWKPPWVSYVGSLIMVFLSLIIAEENKKCMVYISGAVILEFWWPVALFQSHRNFILFDLEACKLSCGWIITGKLFNSTDGHERDGFSFEEICPAMHGNMAVGLVLPWFGKVHLISGFLLEVSLWCRDYMMWVHWQPSMMPAVQLQKASKGINLQLLPFLFFVCTGAEAKQLKFLLVLKFGICYVELPIVPSNFQSYILVSEVLSEKPVVLHFICRSGHKFLLQPWPPPDPFLALGDQFSLCGNQLVAECGGLQPKPPWPLVFPEDDSTNYDPSKHVWLLLLDSGKIQMLLLSSIQVKIYSSVHEMIAINLNLQLVWHFSALTFESWILETHSLEGMMLLLLCVNSLLYQPVSKLMAEVLLPMWICSRRHITHCILLAEIAELLLPYGFLSAAVSTGPEIFSYHTTHFVCFSEYMVWHVPWPTLTQLIFMAGPAQSQLTPWPPPFKDHGKGLKSELLAVFLSNFGCSKSLLNLMSVRPLSQSKLMPFQLYASVLGCAVSKCIMRLLHCDISLGYMEHWFELFAGDIQVDLCDIRDS